MSISVMPDNQMTFFEWLSAANVDLQSKYTVPHYNKNLQPKEWISNFISTNKLAGVASPQNMEWQQWAKTIKNQI